MIDSKLFSFEKVNNDRLKIIYNGAEPIKIGITPILTGGGMLGSFFFTFNCFGHWIIPDVNYKGCRHISLHDLTNGKHLFNWLLPSELSKGVDKQKIIGIGLNKTGTTSLEKDLTNFGYNFPPTIHGSINIISDVYHGDYSSMYSALQNPRFDAYQDVPYSLPKVYKKIYKIRPDDLYVLTVRDNVDIWIESVINFHGKIIKSKNINGNNDIFQYIHGFQQTNYSNFDVPLFKLWGLKHFENLEKKLKEVYHKHNESVINFFEKKYSKNFIVIDVSKKGELKKLTDWIGIDNQKTDFSWENKRQ